ncbi:hypothetical protein [Sphingobacterium sp. JB170]|uniref:hypothetical protein n=1 Tax=Sphingobacterium sp. JB170 TaxID=1434842 RepID=UPI00097EDC4C|nr:hypothetical protein [Sphingobacterium sp. JB170]SJN47926.1 hypothetical protein FM107_16460 [Sphingobacterium sp. JB170]
MEIQLRGKTTQIKFVVKQLINMLHADVTWKKGDKTTFYKGLYGDPTRWEAKDMPDDLILLLSAIFETETPIIEDVIDQHTRFPKR